LAVAAFAKAGLGALDPDTSRAILVVSVDGELAVAIRERVDTQAALIRDVRPHEIRDGIAACTPFPWMAIGAGRMPDDLIAAVHAHPVLVFWQQPRPRGLPCHVREFRRFDELLDEVQRALTSNVGGLRLASGTGVQFPGGRCVASPQLEALIAGHPDGFGLPLRAFRRAERVLGRYGAGVRVRRDPATQRVVLA